MITSIRGELVRTDVDSVTIRVGGIGLRALVPSNVIQEIGAVGDDVALATRLLVRDDRLDLFGFATERQAALFDQVQTVGGVGPRLALAILSTFAPEQFAAVLENEDLAQLTRVTGLGKRTASRIILELKGKLNLDFAGGPASAPSDDLVDALTALGYGDNEAREALSKSSADMSEEDRIRAALEYLAGE